MAGVRFILSAALLVVALFSLTNGLPNCPAGEVFKLCGSACPLTCANLANPPACTNSKCVVGCFCQPGYYRNGARNCVIMSAC